jgi:hypothetical protein
MHIENVSTSEITFHSRFTITSVEALLKEYPELPELAAALLSLLLLSPLPAPLSPLLLSPLLLLLSQLLLSLLALAFLLQSLQQSYARLLPSP